MSRFKLGYILAISLLNSLGCGNSAPEEPGVSGDQVTSQQVRPYDDEQNAFLQRIEDLGGIVTRDESAPSRPVTKIQIHSHEINDKDMAILKRFEDLMVLLIASDEVSDDGMRELVRCPKLAAVLLECSKLTDAGMKTLAMIPTLVEVQLTCSSITDLGISELHRVQKILLQGESITDATVDCLTRFENLRTLSLWGSGITDRGMAQLRAMRTLTCLELRYCYKVSEEGIKGIAAMENLQALFLIGVDCTDACLNALGMMPNLVLFTVSPYWVQSNRNLVITDDGLAAMANLKNLKSLTLDQCSTITDSSVETFARLSGLTHLSLKETGISEEGYQKLKSHLRNTNIQYAPIPPPPTYPAEHPDIVESIEARGGYVVFDKYSAGGPVTAVGFSGENQFGDDDFAQLGNFKQLKHLIISDEPLSDASAKNISQLSGLQYLWLSKCDMTESAFADFQKSSKVDSLDISEMSISRGQLNHLTGLKYLKRLGLYNCKFNTEDLSILQDSPALERLAVSQNTINDEGAAAVVRIERLKSLSLFDLEVSENALKKISKAKNLESIMITRCAVTDDDLVEIAKLNNLEHVHLTDTPITDAGIIALSKSRRLKTLWVMKCSVTDIGLKSLSELKTLAHVSLRKTKVTDEGVASFQKACPQVLTIVSGSNDEDEEEMDDADK